MANSIHEGSDRAALTLHHYITLQDASEVTGLSYYFLRELVIKGAVKSIKSGVKWFIDESSLAAYLDGMSGAENGK